MLISKREAATMLGGLGLSRRHAEQVLDAGLAGLAQHGPVPLVVTVGGFVARAADITAVHAADSQALAPTVFTLDRPGAWFDSFRDRRHPTGPGKSWLLQGRHRHGAEADRHADPPLRL